MWEGEIMPRNVILILVLSIVLAAASLQANEIVLSPSKVEMITSPTDAKDTRVLVYFELSKELFDKKVVIDNALLVFEAQLTDAEFALIHLFPATRAWQTEASVTWDSPWEKAGGDFTDRIAGKCVTLKSAEAGKETISDLTFVVMDWVSGRLANNGLILVPSQADLSESSAAFSFDKLSLKLEIEYTK